MYMYIQTRPLHVPVEGVQCGGRDQVICEEAGVPGEGISGRDNVERTRELQGRENSILRLYGLTVTIGVGIRLWMTWNWAI